MSTKQQGIKVARANIRPSLHYQNTTLSTAQSLANIPSYCVGAYIQAESQTVRWRDDGTAPTASVGNIIGVGDSIWYDGDLTAIKFIETTASAKLNISYYL